MEIGKDKSNQTMNVGTPIATQSKTFSFSFSLFVLHGKGEKDRFVQKYTSHMLFMAFNSLKENSVDPLASS